MNLSLFSGRDLISKTKIPKNNEQTAQTITSTAWLAAGEQTLKLVTEGQLLLKDLKFEYNPKFKPTK